MPAQLPVRGNRFQLKTEGPNTALVIVAGRGPSIDSYNVQPQPNNENVYSLPTQQADGYIMLTASMNGCQFIAYGPDR